MNRALNHLPETPTVLIERGVLGRNLSQMASFAAQQGLKLRPHAKTHKIIEIARAQLSAGATGLSVATIGEAEVFAEAGCRDLFIAYPLWPSPVKQERIRALLAKGVELRLGVDSPQAAAAWAGVDFANLGLMIELDSGHHRSGVAVDQVVEVARAVAGSGRVLRGLFTFPGHSYAPEQPALAARDEHDCLLAARSQLQQAGFEVDGLELSGGSTPSVTLTETGAATEIRPGVYVFNDAQQLELGRCRWEDIALTVAGTVVSRRKDLGQVILDAGSKILGSDRPAWASGFARIMEVPEARVSALSEHHATVVWPAGEALPELGTVLRVVPNHVCLVLNLVDEVTVINAAEVVGTWAVAARGRNN
ncbi:D-threo-3-hydroxyaspartate dehydratase [Corynebacterium occultum]|uniref:D-threo-3-hydroxyaspartate dehydratase n=1 Tax=Corynebacterium occultum TaxID=2675219 RepID=A0A6B8WPI8_9CORY|nr:alanine racemase [Corynebacterium occultum]QGU08258.1 D-threo-3-hydroxyaspartate dehydratase [Corynebacterium occultum]